ncbi:MAG: quinoprotein relay system zinc metallohydrolase 2 [Gammaproteobacteria bacterium]
MSYPVNCHCNSNGSCRNILTCGIIKIGIIIAFKSIILFHFTTVAASGRAPGFNLTEVATGIYVHQGLHVPFEDPQHDDIANIGFIIGQSCVAVIDTGGSVRIGKLLRNHIHKITSVPVCYVINTHIHVDHLLGNIAFNPDTPKFIGHQQLKNAVLRNRTFFLENYAADLGDNPSEASIIGPDITVQETMDLDLGGRRLTVKAYPPAHTFTDLTIYDHKTGTLWLSDLLFIDRIPALDGSLRGWLTVLDKLETTQIDRVIPGHGPVSAHWPGADAAQKRYLTLLLHQTREMIAKGSFMEDVIDTVGREEKKRWLLYDQHHKRNVSKAFTELEWE